MTQPNPSRSESNESVPLRLVVEALSDVLVDYDVPTNRIVAEFRQLLAVYVEAEVPDAA